MADENVTININAKNNTKAAFSGAALAITGLNQAVQVAQQVMRTLKQVYDETVGVTIEYADEVRALNLLIGGTPEEASKLIQAADDVFISFDTLKRGMQIAIKNGLEPTIAGMGELSDQYLAIEDPISRTKFLLDTFGRSGADMGELMKLGSEGIKQLGEDAEKTGLVLSGKTVDASRKYKEELDRLNDSFEGMKVALGTGLIPVLTEYVEVFGNFAEYINKINPDTVENLFRILLALPTMGILSGGAFKSAADSADLLVVATEEVVVATEEVVTAAEEAALAYQEALDSALGFSDNFKDIVGFAEEYTSIQQQIKDKQQEIIDLGADGLISAEDAEKIAGLRGEIDLLKGSITGMANQMVLDMLMVTISIDGVTTAEAEAYFNLAAELGVVSQTGADAAVLAYSNAVAQVKSIISGIPTSKTFTLNFQTAGADVWDLISGGGLGPKPPKASGGSVYAGAGYTVGEHGPEMFVPKVNGAIIPNGVGGKGGGGNITVVINTPVNLADEVFVERKLYPYIKQGIQQAMRGG
jgi:hypothetical protein